MIDSIIRFVGKFYVPLMVVLAVVNWTIQIYVLVKFWFFKGLVLMFVFAIPGMILSLILQGCAKEYREQLKAEFKGGYQSV